MRCRSRTTASAAIVAARAHVRTVHARSALGTMLRRGPSATRSDTRSASATRIEIVTAIGIEIETAKASAIASGTETGTGESGSGNGGTSTSASVPQGAGGRKSHLMSKHRCGLEMLQA